MNGLAVRERGGERVEGILRVNRMATQDRPLPFVLQQLAATTAQLLEADVVSLYLRGGGSDAGLLTMRANVGFPAGAVGNVRLKVGEGITGFPAECFRVISIDAAESDAHFKLVPGLGEERYPVFLAIPLVARDRAQGVVVLQRAESRSFDDAEVELGTALSGAFMLALVRARARREATLGEGAGDEARAARLDAYPVVGGLALGEAHPLPSLDAFSNESLEGDAIAALDGIVAEVAAVLATMLEHLSDSQKVVATSIQLMGSDARFREKLVASVHRNGPLEGLAEVARDYALTPYRLGAGAVEGELWLVSHAQEVATLCLLVASRLAGRPVVETGQVLIMAEAPSATLALHAIARGVKGFVVGEGVSPGSLAGGILRRAGRATVSEVSSLFDWARPGDQLLIDGEVGAVWVNPGPAQVARLGEDSASA